MKQRHHVSLLCLCLFVLCLSFRYLLSHVPAPNFKRVYESVTTSYEIAFKFKKERCFQNIEVVKRSQLNTIELMVCTTPYLAVLQIIRLILKSETSGEIRVWTTNPGNGSVREGWRDYTILFRHHRLVWVEQHLESCLKK